MLPARHRLPFLTWTLAVAAAPAACVLDPKSSGELDDTASSAGTSVGLDGDGGASGPEQMPPDDCGDGEGCSAPVEPQWSSTFSSGSHTWACDVAIDPTGRVALAWHVDIPTAAHPQGWTGIQLYDTSGNLLDAVDVDGQIYGAIAFASDGTLRVRGATALGGGLFQEWARALDPNLQPTWTQPYNQQNGWSQCGWGSRGIEVDEVDQLITYEYVCGDGICGLSLVRRHAANGTLLWMQNPGGNPGIRQAPIALGSDQSTFHGANMVYDDHDEVELRKLTADGSESWMTVLPGDLDGIWGTADGGVLAVTRDFYSDGERHVHRIDPNGNVTWVAGPADAAIYRVAAPTVDENGLFVVADDGLRRTSLALETQWTAAIEHASAAGVEASDILGDTVFAFAGTVDGGTDVWVTVMAAP